ncbi:MAG: flagellar hook-associated protein 2 [Thermotogaceae bacterium]|jgi:flagellar hook-associated protein 2|nr:flagellar hook-associated protein 2 [Thermotogaceae bacterium]MDN5337785.1 flagellar hook-associated protein 2 [Thermotogaceae bacterium]
MVDNINNGPSFRIGGIVSGLDTSSIIEGLLSIESQRLEKLQKQQEILNLRRELFQELDDKLEELMEKVFDLKLSSTFNAKSISSSDEDSVIGSVTSLAQVTSFKVRVSNLVSYTTIEPSETFGKIPASTTQYSDLNSRITPIEGTFYINGVEIEVSSTDTIDDIVNKINSSVSGVTASYNDSTGKLTLSSSSQITISNGTSNFLDVFNLKNSPLIESGGVYSIESTTQIGALTKNTTLTDAATAKGLSFNSGTIKINGVEITIDGTETLDEVLDKINQSDANVYAWYDETADKVFIRSTVGGPRDLVLEDTDSTNLFKILGLESGTKIAGQAASLEVSFDSGMSWTTYYSDSNSFEIAEGINLTALSTTATPVDIKVNLNTDAIIEKISDFVDKYNEVMDYIYTKLNEEEIEDKDWNEMTDDEKKQGLLKNDDTLERIFQSLRNFIYTSVSGLEYSNLTEIGISSGDEGQSYENISKGHIELDEDRLREALSQDLNAVENLFRIDSDENQGIAVQLYSTLREYTKFGGLIDSVAGVNGFISRELWDISERIINEAERLQKREQELWRRFSVMESYLSRFQAQSAWLSQAFGSQQ